MTHDAILEMLADYDYEPDADLVDMIEVAYVRGKDDGYKAGYQSGFAYGNEVGRREGHEIGLNRGLREAR